jgi:hypothetical protein
MRSVVIRAESVGDFLRCCPYANVTGVPES